MSQSLRSLLPNRRRQGADAVSARSRPPGGRAQPNERFAPYPTQPRGSWVTVRALASALAGLGALAIGRLRRVEVHGPSMLPALAAGDRLLVVVTRRVRPGDVVVLRDPGELERLVVKRVHRLIEGGIEVRGDNVAASRDSRDYGPVPRRLVVGRACWRYHPAGRTGRIARGLAAPAEAPP